MNYLKNRSQQCPSEDNSGIIVSQRVTKCGNVTIAKPPCVIDLVSRDVVGAHLTFSGGRRLQLPMIQAMQKHLGQVVHGLPISRGQLGEFVEDEVGDPFGDAGLFERGLTQGTFNHWLRNLQDRNAIKNLQLVFQASCQTNMRVISQIL